MKSKYKQLLNIFQEEMTNNSIGEMVNVILLLMLTLINRHYFSIYEKILSTRQAPPPPPLTFRLALAVKAPAPSITGADQGTAQVGALPLLVYLIVFPIVITTSYKELKGKVTKFASFFFPNDGVFLHN